MVFLSFIPPWNDENYEAILNGAKSLQTKRDL
jgi:hypothetical protein